MRDFDQCPRCPRAGAERDGCNCLHCDLGAELAGFTDAERAPTPAGLPRSPGWDAWHGLADAGFKPLGYLADAPLLDDRCRQCRRYLPPGYPGAYCDECAAMRDGANGRARNPLIGPKCSKCGGPVPEPPPGLFIAADCLVCVTCAKAAEPPQYPRY